MDVNSKFTPFTLIKNKIILFSSTQASSVSATSKTPQTHNYKKTKLFQSTIRFQILSQDVETGPDTTLPPNLDNDNHNNVFKPPPPIFVRGITNFLHPSKVFIEL
jgi:hypothetical protein